MDDILKEALAKQSDNSGEIEKKVIEAREADLNIVADIPLEMTCVLGKANMTVSQLLKLARGSVIELDRHIGEPIELFVNGKLLAKGEVVIVEDKIGITLTELLKEH